MAFRMQTINHIWHGYHAQVLDNLAPETSEYRTARRIFYAGAASLLLEFAKTPESVTGDEIEDAFRILLNEIDEFYISVARREA